jgi:hypothetical protein
LGRIEVSLAPEKAVSMKELLGVALFAFLLFVYFIPTIVAQHHRHRSVGAIAVINLFLGWTFLGWVIALAWAANGNVESPARQQNPPR